jgi:hypothetical protein
MSRHLRAILVAVALAVGLMPIAASARPRLALAVLSSPAPDLVSGGDALVELRGARGPATVTVNGVPSAPLTYDPERRALVGLVAGLRPGRNTIVARDGTSTARLVVTNHSSNGPILSGPQIAPYQCTTEVAGLGKAQDAYCNAPTKIQRFYRTAAGKFEALADGAAPADLATLTLPDGRRIPYIVRVESGTIDRTIYRIAMLDDAQATGTQAAKPNELWNRRLAVKFEGGLAGRYEQGFNVPLQVLDDIYLSRGFAVMNASGLVNGRASNAVLQGEMLMILKEHFIERYGIPRWTVGTGGSGGAIQQINITALYPGLLDGIQGEASFADSQVATHVLDCDLLEHFWKGRDGKVWTDEKKAAAAGYGSAATCQLWTQYIAPGLKEIHKPGCGLQDLSLVYDPNTNPTGARCGIYNLLVNQLGRDEKTGFPLSPWDNRGVQYGLLALNAGKLSVDEFLDLNEHIGGFTGDRAYMPERTTADARALRRLYASGLVNPGGGGLKTVPVMLSRKYGDTEGDFHDRQRDFEIRLRMMRANGDAANQVIWVAASQPDPPLFAPKVLQLEVLDTMTRWLDAIAADPAPSSHAKTVRLRPADAVDAWFDANGVKHPEPAMLDPASAFNRAYPVHGNPRIAAGGPQTNDVLACRLKPVKLSDYSVAFTAEQGRRLRQVFPAGVCDFGKRGIGQVAQAGTYVRY